MRLDQWVPLRRFLHGEPHHLFDLLIAKLTRCSWTRLIAQPGDAFNDEPVAPQTHSETGSAQFRCHCCVACSARTLQNNTGAEGYRPSASRLPRYALQLGPLHRAH
jgi:hypothetical protein